MNDNNKIHYVLKCYVSRPADMGLAPTNPIWHERVVCP